MKLFVYSLHIKLFTYPPVVAVAGWPLASFLLTSANTASISSSSKAKYTGYCNRTYHHKNYSLDMLTLEEHLKNYRTHISK